MAAPTPQWVIVYERVGVSTPCFECGGRLVPYADHAFLVCSDCAKWYVSGKGRVVYASAYSNSQVADVLVELAARYGDVNARTVRVQPRESNTGIDI